MKFTIAVSALALTAMPALAQSNHSGHAGMNSGQMTHSMQPTAANPYGPAEMKMHERMMTAQGANADETWIRKMIEHHRGAIEMSNIQIARGANAQVKAEARKTIASQQREINLLNAMLRRMGKRAQ